MGYWGKEERTYVTNETRYVKNGIWMLGADATLNYETLELNLQFIHRDDDNPNFLNEFNDPDLERRIKTNGGFAELIYRPEGDESDWYSVALFNWIESGQTDLNLKQLGVHFGYLLRRNIRLVAEYSQNFTAKYGTIGVGFVTAF